MLFPFHFLLKAGWLFLILVTVHIDFSYSLLVFLNDAKKTMTGLEKGKRKEK